MADQKELFVKMVLGSWNAKLRQTEALLAELNDEQLLQEVAPGKNRGIYLLGHLIAVHDKLFYILGTGNPIFPDYEEIFVNKPDRAINELPSIQELRQSWSAVHAQLANSFDLVSPDQWFERHRLVSEADFATAPHRNKLNVVLSRASHVDYHLGQLIFLKKQEPII
jgi:hypothetical protein